MPVFEQEIYARFWLHSMRNNIRRSTENFRKKFLLVSKLFSNPVIKVILFPIAIFLVFVFTFIAPLISEFLILVSQTYRVKKHFSFVNKILFIPSTILSIFLFIIGASALGLAYLIWVFNVFSLYFGFLGVLFALFFPQAALIIAPFIVLLKSGLLPFFEIFSFLIIVYFYSLQRNLIIPANKVKINRLDFQTHSSWIYICGAFSTHILGFLLFKFIGGISNQSVAMWVLAYLGSVFIILALISSIIWYLRKDLHFIVRQAVYKPSIWILVSAYLLLKIIGGVEIPSAVPSLDIVFIALIFIRIISSIINKIKSLRQNSYRYQEMLEKEAEEIFKKPTK